MAGFVPAFPLPSSPSTFHVRVPSLSTSLHGLWQAKGREGSWETLEGIFPHHTSSLLCAPPGQRRSVTQPGSWREDLCISRCFEHTSQKIPFTPSKYFFHRWETSRLLHRNSWWLTELEGGGWKYRLQHNNQVMYLEGLTGDSLKSRLRNKC